MKALFKEAIETKKQLAPDDYFGGNQKVGQLESRLAAMLRIDPGDKHPKLRAFIKRLNKNKGAIFTFLHHPKVPPDNNASEKAIRNAKVKTKISGQFKTLAGANRFAILRSMIDTAIKNKQNPFKAMMAIASYSIAE